MNAKWIAALAVLVLIAAVVLGIVLSPGDGNKGPDTDTILTEGAGASPSPETGSQTMEGAVVKPASTPPRPLPTPGRVMASKEKGTLIQSDLTKLFRDSEEGLMALRIEGKDVDDYGARLRKLRLEQSHAGYQLFQATDTVSTAAAEKRLTELLDSLKELRQEAGLVDEATK